MTDRPFPPPDTSVDDQRLLELYRAMLVPRAIEDKMLTMLRHGRLSKWFSGIGQEAIAVGVTSGLMSSDWVLPMHRNLGVWTTRGVDLDRLFLQLFGRAGGFTGGRDRTFHFGSLEHRIVGMISHLGATTPTAVGLALAGRLRGEQTVAATFIGEGGSSEGDIHEAMNLAAVWNLPVLFIIEHNGYALSTPADQQFAVERLADRAVGYGMAGETVDGNDVVAVVDAVQRAAARGRAGGGPTILECRTFRMRGHEEASGTDYVPSELTAKWAERDPITQLGRLIESRDLADARHLAAMRDDIDADIGPRINRAFAAPSPSSTAGRELTRVYPPTRHRRAVRSAGNEELRYVDAISAALRTALRTDASVLLLGQDVADYGGVFKVTDGFVDEFGVERVRNTPIIESGAVGAAIGLALDGYRPIVELQFGDFASCAFNQIVNHLATTYYRWGARLPVVIRAPIGGGTGAGPFHSQNIEGWFTHVPGLKVIAPSTPGDVYGLLLEAIEDDGPVLFLEHKRLYRRSIGLVELGWTPQPFKQAAIRRRGTDATIVTYGGTVEAARDAAERAAGRNHQVEVIDLRTLIPWDRATVLDSVRRTGRCLVLHEATRTGGYGAELAAEIGEHAFDALDAPVTRVAAIDTPTPFATTLESNFAATDRLDAQLDSLLRR